MEHIYKDNYFMFEMIAITMNIFLEEDKASER